MANFGCGTVDYIPKSATDKWIWNCFLIKLGALKAFMTGVIKVPQARQCLTNVNR